MQVKDLARGRGEGLTPLDPEQVRIPPGQTHDPLNARSPADRRQEGLSHGPGFQGADRRVDEKPEARMTVLGLLLDKLVVCRCTPEPGRQHLFQHGNQISIWEGHSSGRELFMTSNGVEVPGPAEPLQGTATPPPDQDTPITQGNV